MTFALMLLISGLIPFQQEVPVSFSPSDKAAGVSINTVLAWPAGAATGYEVHFGLTNPPPFQCRVTRPTFVLDVRPGEGSGLSLEGSDGLHFVTRSD